MSHHFRHAQIFLDQEVNANIRETVLDMLSGLMMLKLEKTNKSRVEDSIIEELIMNDNLANVYFNNLLN